jgi:hypothetical protein
VKTTTKAGVALLALALGVGVYATGGLGPAPGATSGDGTDVTFSASWYASDYDRKHHILTDNAHATWHVSPTDKSGNVVFHGGHFSVTETVTTPGIYTAILNVTTDAPTKLACKIKSGRHAARDPKNDEKNPGTGKCTVTLTFTVK